MFNKDMDVSYYILRPLGSHIFFSVLSKLLPYFGHFRVVGGQTAVDEGGSGQGGEQLTAVEDQLQKVKFVLERGVSYMFNIFITCFVSASKKSELSEPFAFPQRSTTNSPLKKKTICQ